ncbi:MAG: right-handed parallel beta-helix repeat-containing protein [Verrucomicrobia bacterium]|nr:right-handed parallel beta-helix repeat-containing protein [Verrucomicrobiota bacterium]
MTEEHAADSLNPIDTFTLKSGRSMLKCARRVAVAVVTLSFSFPALAAIYVAPGGNDDSAGTREQPLATLSKAVISARSLPADQPRRIILRGGSYWNVAVVLGPQDSGLTLEAAAGETPVLHGGQRLTGWVKEGDAWVAAPLPDLPVTEAEVAAGLALPQWEVRLLLVNGQSRPRARFPESGELPHLSSFDVSWMSTTGGGWQRKPTIEELTTLRYRSGDLPADLEVRDAEITVYHMWDESCVGIASHEPDHGLLELAPATGHPPGAFGVRKFVVWNVRAGLTQPGQWYHDRVRNRIVYWPLPGERINQAEVVVPTRRTVLRLAGLPGQPVRQVTLRGLTLTATTAPLIAGGFAAAAFDGAISLSHTEDCVLDTLTVQGVAGHGIDAGRSCVRMRVSRSEITDCGAGGIYVGGTGAVISDNHVHGIGRAYPSAIGIYRGGRDGVVRHNEIHDVPYSAINYGGTGNVVEYNLIYDCMKVLHDGAAIYLFAARDCVLRGNVARDIVDTGGYGASAYYLDERSTGCVVERNLALRVARPLHNHMATNNVIRDNVFLVEGDAKLTFPRSEDFTMTRNILYATGSIRVEGMNAVTNWAGNLFFSGTGRIEGVRMKQYATADRAEPLPEGILAADPLFRDWRQGDYRFREGSPAHRLDLRPIEANRAGPSRP